MVGGPSSAPDDTGEHRHLHLEPGPSRSCNLITDHDDENHPTPAAHNPAGPSLNWRREMITLTATTGVVIPEAEPITIQSAVLSTTDLIVGTIIALVMATVFTLLSSGMSLIVTF